MLHSRVWDRGSRDSHTSQSKLGRTSSVDQRGVDDGGQVVGLYLLFGGQGGGFGGYRLSLDYGKIVEADDHV